jgi:hypothetical protein
MRDYFEIDNQHTFIIKKEGLYGISFRLLFLDLGKRLTITLKINNEEKSQCLESNNFTEEQRKQLREKGEEHTVYKQCRINDFLHIEANSNISFIINLQKPLFSYQNISTYWTIAKIK